MGWIAIQPPFMLFNLFCDALLCSFVGVIFCLFASFFTVFLWLFGRYFYPLFFDSSFLAFCVSGGVISGAF